MSQCGLKHFSLRNRANLYVVLLAAALVGLCGGMQAQSFQTVGALAFTAPYGGANPLPQVVTVASSGAAFPYTQAVTTSSGGKWLAASPCGYYSCTTPYPVAVSVTTAGLAAGTYQGQIVFTDVNNSKITLTVPVTLTVTQTNTAFFDYLPGALSFTMKPGGSAVPQPIQIRNGGTGTLTWTLTTTTADGGAWLSATGSGTAPSNISVTIVPASLPGGGAISGTYVGELVLQTSGDTTTIPVAVTVGSAVFEQINPINFTMPVGGANPLPQILTVETTDNSSVAYTQAFSTASGGSWLTASPCGYYSCSTPYPITVSVQNASTLAAGTYMGEITVYQSTNPQMSITVPVTLTVVASGAFFNNLPGGLSFTMVKGGKTVAQTIQIENAGTGTLSWTVSATTSDGGVWLSTSPASGTAPSETSISIAAASLPGGGEIAGTYVGELVFQTAGDTTTIPVAVTVGTNVFNQVNPISFTMPVGGANPLPQILTIASTVNNTPLNFTQATATATGGNWLATSPCSYYSCNTPYPLTVSVQNASTLPAGTYTGEITVFQNTNPQMSITVPVTLTVEASGAFFNNLPGGLSFSLIEGGTAVQQTIEIENGGSGTLNWTVTPTTADGGAWLSATPTSGAAPAEVNVSITAANLPGGGQIAGTYSGQLLFQTGTDTTTVPIEVTVGSNVFTQVNPISFTMPVGGANPLPQILTIASSVYNSSLSFTQATVTATGGNWLATSPCSYYSCNTPYPLTVSVQNANTLSAGTYTGEVTIFQSSDPSMSVTIPVTLNVVASGAFFNGLPGQLSFTMPQNAKKLTPQSLEITNAGSGKMKFAIAPSTADGGAWLTATSLSGTAPKTVSVEINPLNLPGGGQIDGTFAGQLLLVAGSDTTTIPVTVTVGSAVFTQMNPLNFVMPVGGANPLPQLLTVASIDNSALNFTQAAASSGWLTVAPCSYYSCTTGYPLTVSVGNTSKLTAGVYAGQVTIYQSTDPGQSMTVPVTLTVVPSSKAFFDNLPGQTSFSLTPGTKTTPAQTITLGNGGSGTLSWKIATNTADTGKWLKVTPASGSNAGTYSVAVTVKSLPGGGAKAGTFLGQELLETASGNVTVPVVVTVASPVFVQVPAVIFNTTVGTNPAPQSVPIDSTGTVLNFTQASPTGKGGAWLTVSPCSYYSCSTPTSLTVSVNSSSLGAGTYYAEINIYEYTDPAQSMTIPVVLNVAP